MDAQDFLSIQEAYMEVYDELDESAAGDVAARAQKLANQRKGQTPERKATYQSLADKAAARERGPFQRGDTRKGLTSSERTSRRDDDAYHSDVNNSRPGKYQHGEPTYGKGGITKNPRKLAQQKARGQHAEQYDLYDIILSHLLDEGYAETPEAAEVMMVNMSEEWRESIVEEEILSEGTAGLRRTKHDKMRRREYNRMGRGHNNRIMKFQTDSDDMDRVIQTRNKKLNKGDTDSAQKVSSYMKKIYPKPQLERERRLSKRPPSRLRSGSLPS
jgi:pyruvate/2-oxoglutarate dehydrogenase complex dihydrolipoamide acyltransferase (E2) component